jgi:glycosyltransferase involved in cell wall biosynthesis
VKIAMLGTRGVPASYSGFETCVEQVGKRLAARGHEVIVYCRRGRTGPGASSRYLGMERIILPAIRTKGAETLSHTLLSSAHAVARARPDAAVVFGVGNAIFCRVLDWGRIPSAINVDGADWARKKWGRLGRGYLRWSERIATRAADALIADSHSVAAYYEREYRAPGVFIPYGAEVPSEAGTATLDQFGLQPRRYLLAVGRFVPENGFDQLIRAYNEIQPPMPLVVVGDAPYSEDYKRSLKAMAPPGVIFTGYQFGMAYHELSRHAYAFLFAAEVGGTHPVLVEQLAHGNCVLARWTESNAEVMGDAGIFFRDSAELVARLREILGDAALVERKRAAARARGASFSWDRVTDQYEELLFRVAKRARVAA